jgi:hypothetical protein
MKSYKKLTRADFKKLVNGEEVSIKLITGDEVRFILEDIGFDAMFEELRESLHKRYGIPKKWNDNI